MIVPRTIETKFRMEIGAISPYLSIIEIATKELLNSATSEELQKLSRKYDHSRLAATHIDPKGSLIFVHLSHIAFIASRADAFCEDVINFMKAANKDENPPNLHFLDRLRRTIYRVEASKDRTRELDAKDESIYSDYVGTSELAVIDYYRSVRNMQFHGGNWGSAEIKQLGAAAIEQIVKHYKHVPNGGHNLTTRDTVLYSQAWQAAAVNICQKLVKLDVVVEDLCHKYRNHKFARRDHAISAKLKQDYLQSDEAVDIFRSQTNGWVA